ncbi:hypothetical protein D9758_001903 [Tetrapyrgos nigripes]|uniref:Uncharacterized protein n=1 Tax=Tetrapyrgos nigripes TaxID=182062 RepID=A0A8H5GSW8_9AGAR|nr:hypothetical protein D9758_001903 [Tetrapyrgos nigripes]
MILLDAEDQQQHPKLQYHVAGATARPPESSLNASQPSLPDYETSQAQHSPQPFLNRKYPFFNTVDTRFWRAALYALAIYVVLTIAIGVPLLITRIAKHKIPHPHPADSSFLATPLEYANAKVFAMDRNCNAWDISDEFSASVSHSLSAQGSFSIRSTAWQEAAAETGSPIYGNLTVDVNPDPSVSSAVFHVTVLSSIPLFYENSHICFNDDGSDRGLSVYIPSNFSGSESLTINVFLLFPQTTVLSLNNLVTYLPMFSQRIGALAPRVSFDQVEIEGSSMDIHCDSLKARQITVQNSLAAISGSYNASSSLKLDTISAPINANITLVQDDTSKAPTYLSLDTGNGEINANVTMLADASQLVLHPMIYMGHVKNFNAPLRLNVAHHPSTPPARLELIVENHQAESNVTLDDKFVGIFDVQSKLSSASVEWDNHGSGSSPTRNVVYDETSSTSRRHGWIGWGSRPEKWDQHKEGRVVLVSSLSPVLLQLGSGMS